MKNVQSDAEGTFDLIEKVYFFKVRFKCATEHKQRKKINL